MPLQHLDKVKVLQEAKALFKQTPINAKKCAFMITKIEALLGRGEILTPDEASEIFFSCTSLFISKDVWCTIESHFVQPHVYHFF